MTPFITDRRGVSEVIGAVVIFGFLILTLSAYQTVGVPAQNTDIEVSHSFDVQDDLAELQSAVVANVDSQRTQAVTVDLAPQYPTRILTINAPPPSGQVTTETVGTGNITSSGFDVNQACRLSAGSANAVPTQSISYLPRYNYFDDGNVPHRIEHTLFYQADSEGDVTFVRSNDSLVDPASRTVSLSPIQGRLQADGTQATTVRLVRGYERTVTATDATITLPTVVSADVWRDQLTAGSSDVTVTNVSPTAVEVTFTGQWAFQCAPIGVNDAPEQLPTADAGSDVRVAEGSTVQLDGSNSEPSATLDYAWGFATAAPPGVSLEDETTQTPVLNASNADVSSQTPVDVQLTVTGANGNTDTDTATVTITPVSGGGTGGTTPTPSLTATVENLPTDSTATQEVTFSPTERTIPAGETVAIDLSNANGVTANGDPNPVNYENINIVGNFSGSFNTVDSGDTFVVEFTPNTNIGTGRTIEIQLQSTQTQDTVRSEIPVVISRSDGDGVSTTFSLFDGNGGGGGGVAADVVEYVPGSGSAARAGPESRVDLDIENTGNFDVQITEIEIDSTSGSLRTLREDRGGSRQAGQHEVFIDSSTPGIFEASGNINSGQDPGNNGYTLGSRVTLTQQGTLTAGETAQTTLFEFRNNGGQPVSAADKEITVTLYFQDGSQTSFTFTPPGY